MNKQKLRNVIQACYYLENDYSSPNKGKKVVNTVVPLNKKINMN